MPGLLNKEKWTALPLSVSDITSCVRGYTLAMTASMTYENIEDHAIEGIFIYPLEENSTVVGFEAMISSQIITLQIKDKAKIDDCQPDVSSATGTPQSGSGHVVMDEDLERTVLVVNLGVIPPMETVSILVSTSSELSTLADGGIRVCSPSVCTPKVQRTVNEEQGLSPNFTRTRERSTTGHNEQTPSSTQPGLVTLLEEESINSMDYQFNFNLEIRAQYLLSGVESPSHAIRADADPLARSATSVVITLADKYTYDCPVEILIYPSEPHLPHVLIEDGDMTQEEYDEHLQGRSDFIKATKKDPSDDKKVDVIHKRLHKDILHNPVVMLNFCPDLKLLSSDLRKVHGEFIFLIDRSGSMSGISINRVKDAMVVILKSLMPGCLFNILGFGSTFRALFSTSQNYQEDTLALACEYIKRVRADMGGTNLLTPLHWALRQPLQSGHPRLLFLLTDGAVSNTGRVIELMRSHARYARCHTFGIGQGACRRLLQGLATVSKGTAEFLAEGECLQPKMINSLKRTMMSPVLSDIAIEWLFPETKEVLLSPVGSSFLFPGDRLIGYSVVCDTTRLHPNPNSDKRRRYSMLRSNESASSVFFHSQEEEPWRSSESEAQGVQTAETASSSPFSPSQDFMSESSPVSTQQDTTASRRRAYSTNQIVDFNPGKKVYTPSDPSSVVGKNPLRRAKAQELVGQTSPDYGAQWKDDYQSQLESLCATASRVRPAGGPRAPSQQEADADPQTQTHARTLQAQEEPLAVGSSVAAGPPAPAAAGLANQGTDGSRSSTESPSVGSLGDTDAYAHQLCEVETPQDGLCPGLPACVPPEKGDCMAVVTGLLCGQPVRWEVVFDIKPYLNGREREEKVHEDLWNETFHHLAGRSILRNFEHMAEKKSEIEHGSGRRYQLYAIHTSKACNILSKYTAFVPVDLDTNEYLETSIEYINTCDGARPGSHSSSRRRKRGYSVGLGRSQSGCMSEENDEALLPNSEDGASPCSTPSSAGWESCSFTETSQRSPSVTSDQSQRSVESLFSARLTLSRTRLLTRAARGFMCRSNSKMGDSAGESDNKNKDYIPVVSLQMACGAFPLDGALCDAISVPMDKLKWTSPFSSHRASLGPHLSHSAPRHIPKSAGGDGGGCSAGGALQRPHHLHQNQQQQLQTAALWPSSGGPRTEAAPSSLGGGLSSGSSPEPALASPSQTDSGRGSETESQEAVAEAALPLQRLQEVENMVWATAVALAWLEHSSAGYFIEWELVAAKASMWLSDQRIPEGRDLASVKAAANQLFIILRHWDENLQLNMLCYNPNSV
ncbi:von Willebrand factor A domain-containing protein 5B1 [Gadus morhua]|uniref:von Willebrand factor A domain-containing protein 5B1 n=1 Tax=Gadus morhua TaxID=8049 RepID=UPI0011B63065|nr:von Willebrand factor A domain-containing protein 5B1 [Gadus morhua]